MAVETKLDPSDGLLALQAQEWAQQKHELLRRYVELSGNARRGFVDGPGGATYIELFCGPGKLFLKDTENFFDGSPLVVAREALANVPFTAMLLGDESDAFCNAVGQRIRTIGGEANVYHGAAVDNARRIASNLNPHGLHFAFLDPFGLDLPFAIVQEFARFKRMDILIHVSAMDLQRNLPAYVRSVHCVLDDFAPGWREAVSDERPDEIVARGRLLEYWLGIIRKEGFQEAKQLPLIRGYQNQPLYWLVLISKHGLARKFWDALNRPTQGDMF
jgi:three-Cys-motif partner protein